MQRDDQTLRSDLLNVSSLQRRARELAEAHRVGSGYGASRLLPRLMANEKFLAGLLLTVRAGLLELAEQPGPSPTMLSGLADTLDVFLELTQQRNPPPAPDIAARLSSLAASLHSPPASLAAQLDLLTCALEIVSALPPYAGGDAEAELSWWRAAVEKQCREQHEEIASLARLRQEQAEARYGFYEAIDYTPSRVSPGQSRALVRSFMAHHQGMILLALAHHLRDRPMQRRFGADPLLKATELLLQERVPKETSVLYPHELEAERPRESAPVSPATWRLFTDPNAGPPEVHLLSNGRYHVMISNAGGGYSVWNDTALTRWREDPTRDCWGTFLYLRDLGTGQYWSNSYQPTLQLGSSYEAIFSQGHAEFRCRVHDLDAHTEISVSPEDDVEVRRVTL